MLAAYLNLLYYTCKNHHLFHLYPSSILRGASVTPQRTGCALWFGIDTAVFMIEHVASSACMLTAISFPSSIYIFSTITVSSLRYSLVFDTCTTVRHHVV